MAYMNQEKKAVIAAELKKIMPKGWKYSLAVKNHSTLSLTIREAPVDLIRGLNKTPSFDPATQSRTQITLHNVDNRFADPEIDTLFTEINRVMNLGNWDRSEYISDYIDVGFYTELNIGTYEKPFIFRG